MRPESFKDKEGKGYQVTYQKFFLWMTKDGKEDGPYCIPCSTKDQLRELKEENGGWRCDNCLRVFPTNCLNCRDGTQIDTILVVCQKHQKRHDFDYSCHDWKP